MTVKELQAQREVLIGYLRAKLIAEDWHAVADAAMDLREIEAELKGREAGKGRT